MKDRVEIPQEERLYYTFFALAACNIVLTYRYSINVNLAVIRE